MQEPRPRDARFRRHRHNHAMRPPRRPASERALPEDLAELAAERLVAATAAERPRVLEELAGEHPRHRAALQRLCADLAGAERLLDAGFGSVGAGEPPAPDREPTGSIG